MVGMRGISFDIPTQNPTKLWIIEDGNNQQVYTIVVDTKQCDKTTLPLNPMRCIPGLNDF